MKIAPSRYVLVAEILTIFCFHLAKIKQAEKHPVEPVFTKTIKTSPAIKPADEKRTGFAYMAVSIYK